MPTKVMRYLVSDPLFADCGPAVSFFLTCKKHFCNLPEENFVSVACFCILKKWYKLRLILLFFL